ncbi:MAG: TRAP transporter small permease, partial [Desulfobacca sp.]|nr:TRAP transporter small permease [Desulfobacca sp.]
GVFLLFAMCLLAFANVLTRYFIRYSFAFTEEIEVACLVWLTMLGAAAGFKRGIHLGFNLLALRFPTFGKKILSPLAVFVTLATVCLLVWYGFLQVRDEISLNIQTEALNIPQWWYTLSIPVGGILILFRLVEAAWKERKGTV